jgi:hypothetical protein
MKYPRVARNDLGPPFASSTHGFHVGVDKSARNWATSFFGHFSYLNNEVRVEIPAFDGIADCPSLPTSDVECRMHMTKDPDVRLDFLGQNGKQIRAIEGWCPPRRAVAVYVGAIGERRMVRVDARSYQRVKGFVFQGWDIIRTPSLQVQISNRKQSHRHFPAHPALSEMGY